MDHSELKGSEEEVRLTVSDVEQADKGQQGE